MKKIFEIARWEFIEKVKTKTFIISLILTPAILIIFSVAPTLLSEQETSQTKVIGLIDTSEARHRSSARGGTPGRRRGD